VNVLYGLETSFAEQNASPTYPLVPHCAFVEHAIAIGVCVQALEIVPGFWQVSVVNELLSLHWESAEHTGVTHAALLHNWSVKQLVLN
jgi:hypothetical protein